MARPQRCRRICREPEYENFAPQGVSAAAPIQLSLDEFEVIRLVDLEKLTHEQCAARMDISRTTVTEICESAHTKLAACIVEGRSLLIGGGNYRLCDGSSPACPEGRCGGCHWTPARTAYACITKGENVMRIAVTYENGQVFPHFGHTEQFKLYDVEEGKITAAQVVDTQGSGHGALAGFLAEHQVNALICGGIGGGAQVALESAGIRLYAGVDGSADQAVAALLAGTLDSSSRANCTMHQHEAEGPCGDHGCGHSCH
ncbi:MAG: DUF134 domain-containing protein [Firmicutes bacterium]|nr:DUF134 domain-containing protein [Bacillota bacterium]